MQQPKFQTGDIICVSGKSLFKSIIGWFSRQPGESKVYAKHIAGFKDTITISEAVWTVKETNIDNWLKKHKYFEVWRKKDLTKHESVKIFDYLDSKEGSLYGGWKLFLFAGDYGLSKLLWKDIYLFRRLGFSESFPICSWLYAYAYDNINYRFCGYDPNYLDPDTMHRCMKKSDEWELVYKKG